MLSLWDTISTMLELRCYKHDDRLDHDTLLSLLVSAHSTEREGVRERERQGEGGRKRGRAETQGERGRARERARERVRERERGGG